MLIYDEYLKQINHSLEILKSLCNSRMVYLTDTNGQQIASSGRPVEIDLESFSSAVCESLNKIIVTGETIDHNNSAIQMIYRESNPYHFYAINVGKDLVLFLVNEHNAISHRVGTVWNYAQKTALDLQNLVGKSAHSVPKEMIPDHFIKDMDDELDSLFSEEI